ncbi:MAG: hypothetical protein R6U39_01465 [Candidatus Aegiribacteria sp.]
MSKPLPPDHPGGGVLHHFRSICLPEELPHLSIIVEAFTVRVSGRWLEYRAQRASSRASR